MSKSYSQPTVLWTLSRGSESAKAVFVPHALLSTLVIFRNGSVESVEDVSEWSMAIEHAESLRAALHEEGWRDHDLV